MTDFQAILDGTRSEVLLDLSWDDYVKAEGLNPSTVAPGLKSMKHLHASRDEHDKSHKRPANEEGMMVGAATHALMLERDKFNDRFAVYDAGSRPDAPPSGRRGTNDWQAFAEENPGKELLPLAWFERADRIADAVLNDPQARKIIEATKHEVSCFAVDPEFTFQWKGRIDCIGGGWLADLKGTTNVEAGPFGSVCAKLRYLPRLACYRRMFEIHRFNIQAVRIIAYEMSEPFDVVVYRIDLNILDEYWNRVKLRVLRNLRTCIKNDDWPGVGEGREQEISIPMWWDAESVGRVDWEA